MGKQVQWFPTFFWHFNPDSRLVLSRRNSTAHLCHRSVPQRRTCQESDFRQLRHDVRGVQQVSSLLQRKLYLDHNHHQSCCKLLCQLRSCRSKQLLPVCKIGWAESTKVKRILRLKAKVSKIEVSIHKF